MSAKQLDVLWHLETKISHECMGMPLRLCSAEPSSTWGTDMNKSSFHELQMQIREMWSIAAQSLECFECDGDKGFGLRVCNNFKGNV